VQPSSHRPFNESLSNLKMQPLRLTLWQGSSDDASPQLCVSVCVGGTPEGWRGEGREQRSREQPARVRGLGQGSQSAASSRRYQVCHAMLCSAAVVVIGVPVFFDHSSCLFMLPFWMYGSTAQHSAAQRSTAQHSAAQCSTVQCSTECGHATAKHSTAKHSTAQHSTVQHRVWIGHSTAQHNTAQNVDRPQHSSAQHSTGCEDICITGSMLTCGLTNRWI